MYTYIYIYVYLCMYIYIYMYVDRSALPYRWTRGHCVSRLDHCLVFLGGGTHDKKMSKGHLPRVVHHQVYTVY